MDIPEKMQGVMVKNGAGTAQDMFLDSVDVPSITPSQILVKISATAINRADTLQRQGKYPVPAGATKIMGLEFAGTVASLGSECSKYKVGDRVFGLLGGGGYAEYVAVEEGHVLPIPDEVTDVTAAGFPEGYITAFQALFWIGGISTTDRDANAKKMVLIHAGASGVSTSGIQLCKLAGVGTIITTAGSKEKLEMTKKLGADFAINYKEEDFAARVAEITEGKGVSVLIDYIGQSYWKKNLDSIGLDGKIVILGFLSGPVLPEGSSIAPILRKRVTITGSTLRSRSDQYKTDLIKDLWEFAGKAFSHGCLRVIIHKELPLSEVCESHRMMEANENIGKIVLKVSSSL
eukprot:CAMPEP_0201521422 /NCGR_PEP_ID=MMETSP0161_2-20130828/14410_1 /ASSEMBLY_ACC=CAM_ASM_000251 /TAXON_ID=180227 /ORGANISM="Neoparamoeba aestuarina, Strain SoJaBio B1-5/56/2" /LENGTH=346 /DNA_ID=CAMNT_0047920055 /DNA_START=119 /DNA_END=1159 /DNA_ORIENTATION=+